MLINPINNITHIKNVPCMPNEKFDASNFSRKDLRLNNTPLAIYNISFTKLPTRTITKLDRFNGCLVGGAIGDALGATVEFKSLEQIKKIYGENGIKDLMTNIESGVACVTDDTQMTIFTIDGLIKGLPKTFDCHRKLNIEALHDSYKLWYKTQVMPNSYEQNLGWINNIEELYANRNAGNTCLQALKGDKIGSVENPINNSKGNGCVMRVSPIGLLYNEDPVMAYENGKNAAAITHGHPTGYHSAGFIASLIAYITNGTSLNQGIKKTLSYMQNKYDKEEIQEVTSKIQEAMSLSKTNLSDKEVFDIIGTGWTAEEAVGLSLYCALKYGKNFEQALRSAVNHSGDSDTVGAITGNILGCLYGYRAIPNSWTSKVQFNDILLTLSDDLYRAMQNPENFYDRYPFYKNKIPKWYDNQIVKKEKPQKLAKIKFDDNDIERMSKMTTEERIKYKQNLIEKNKFKI